MRKLKYYIFTIINLVILLTMIFMFTSFKVQSNEPIMYVDLKSVIQNVPQYNQIQQDYKNDYIKVIQELKQKQMSINGTNSQIDFEKLQVQAANELHLKYIKKFNELQDSIKNYVAQYAKDRGITIVLNGDSIVYGDNICDITNDIVRYIINNNH
jgi:Skp family chaperone for outer membrane proteins